MTDQKPTPETILSTLPTDVVAKLTPPTVEKVREVLAEGEKARAAALGIQQVHSDVARNLRFR